tara:strand:- start:1696 stop:2022 length:327 start_codon:yes stop_codon:yes gene_type:complete
LEESDLIPENKQSKEKSPNNLNSEITDKGASSFEEVDSKSQSDMKSKNLSDKKDTLFRRVIENGFDGITTNPNYKLLALLIILLINLSLFFVVGNIGKNFLRNSGILG